MTKFSAIYSNTFIEFKNQDSITLQTLRPYYIKGYNQNMSMQLMDLNVLELFADEYKQFVKYCTIYLSIPPEAGEISIDILEENYIQNVQDERETIERQVKARRGQQKFRNALRNRYGDSCMITGCAILDLLEAAHIKSYRGINDNNPLNGLLLRADIHTLFDLNLLAIDPLTLKIHLSKKLIETEYNQYHNKDLIISSKRPDIECLKERWAIFDLLQV